MIDLAQCDSTLRTQTKDLKYYYVIDNNGMIYGSFDNQANAVRFCLKDIDNLRIIAQAN